MTVFYVSTSGNDGNPGTASSPLKSITKAAQLAQPGDTVMVGGGVYNSTVTINKDGTATAPITFRPVSGEKPIIDGSQTAANSDLVIITGDYVIFEGFEIRNAKRGGIVLWDTHDTKVVGNKVHDCFRAGIWAGGNLGQTYRNTIEANEVWNNVRENVGRTWSGGWAQGISLDKSDDSIIRNNKVWANWGEGIGAMFTIGAKILNNTAYDNFSVNIYLDNAQAAVASGNIVYHNADSRFYRNGKPGVGIQIANENGSRMLPSKNIIAVDNILAGVGDVHYSTFQGNTGLVDCTLAPNTLFNTPKDYFDSVKPQPDPTPDPTPVPTPVIPNKVSGTIVLRNLKKNADGSITCDVELPSFQFTGAVVQK